MQIQTRLCDQVSRYLDLAVSEMKVTAQNMANIDTPGYRSQGFDFEAEMRTALAKPEGRKTSSLHIGDVDGLVSRADGNNVSMDREGLNMAEAQLKFKTGVAIMRIENQRVMDAIRTDK